MRRERRGLCPHIEKKVGVVNYPSESSIFGTTVVVMNVGFSAVHALIISGIRDGFASAMTAPFSPPPPVIFEPSAPCNTAVSQYLSVTGDEAPMALKSWLYRERMFPSSLMSPRVMESVPRSESQLASSMNPSNF